MRPSARLAIWLGACYDGHTRWPQGFDPKKDGAILVGPHQDLRRVQFPRHLTGADLHQANLMGALLTDADLRGADLQAANLINASMENAQLQSADLRRANLERAGLLHANLKGAHLKGARYDRRTQWPAGFNPQAHGAVFVRMNGTEL